MNKTIYVIGHRNPDTDSIASAIAYAELKRRLGVNNVVAAMAGQPNTQSRFVLDRLGIKPPLYLADVHPKARDVIRRGPITATADTPLKQALEVLHRNNVRMLPIVDDDRKPVGLVSLLKLSEKYLLGAGTTMREVHTTLYALSDSLAGKLLVGRPDTEMETLHLFVGAMQEESFAARIEGYEPKSMVIITGDRFAIQQAAIEKGIRLLIVTGGMTVAGELLEKAKANAVSVMSTPFDSANTAWLARLSTPIGRFAEDKFERVGLAEPLQHLRLKLLNSAEPAVLVVEEDGTIAGVATKSSLLTPIPYALILMDHNELGQAVAGAGSVEVLEVIDHHKLGNFHTSQPISFVTAPVGSTCTLVAGLYLQHGEVPDPPMAGLLLSGILSDTLILKSPTATDRDREMALWLADRAGVRYDDFGTDLFSSGSGLATYGSPEDVITGDFKTFVAADTRFGIGQVEVLGFDDFFAMKDALKEALSAVRQQENLHMVGLLVTDIYSENSLLLMEGKKELAYVIDYPQMEPHLYELKGVLSRKKQLVPYLLKAIGKLSA